MNILQNEKDASCAFTNYFQKLFTASESEGMKASLAVVEIVRMKK